MDLDSVPGRFTKGCRRRALALIFTAMSSALTLAIASPAQATPNVAKAWGLNNFGQLGDGTNTGPEKCGPEMKTPCSSLPVAVSGLSGVTTIAGGPAIENSFSVALLEGGTVRDWGHGAVLGNGTTESSDVPVAVCAVGPEEACPTGPYLSGVTAISAGEQHALALVEKDTEKGAVVAWGHNPFGQLGNGTGASSVVPEPVCAAAAASPCSEVSQQLKEVVAIAAGGRHSLALRSDHTVVAWGGNNQGELGDGTTTSSNVPVAVCAPSPAPCPGSHLSEVMAIAAGLRHSLALLKDGTVVAWGDNSSGQLGDGTETNKSVPVAVGGLSEKATRISAGESHSLALLSSGTVKAWGSNESGQLGDGSSAGPEACGISGACAKTPVAVCAGSPPGPCPTGPLLSGVSAVSAGGKHSLALLANGGAARAWGLNGNGQLGDGTSTGPEACGGFFAGSCSTTPVEVSKLFDVKGIAAGGQHSLAFGPPPVVTKLEPSAGFPSGGETVTITGTDFTAATAVTFGGTNVGFTVNSPTSITAVSSADVANAVRDVTVTTGWGTSATNSADQFTYVEPGSPAVKNVSPKRGHAAGGTPVTITGTKFIGVTAVKFGSTNAATFKVNSQTSITAVSPAGTKGTRVAVTVTTSKGTSASSKRAATFRYIR